MSAVPAGAAASLSLQQAGAHTGARIGVVADRPVLEDPAIAQFVVRNFNLLTAGGMKWPQVHPLPDTYRFVDADWNMAFARTHGLRVHGHNLCWNSPSGGSPWFGTVLTKSNAAKILTDHIQTVAGRYKGQIDSWDVVNEPVAPWSHRSDGLYPGIWLNLLGPEYIDVAFAATASADPHALRVLNLHHVEQDTPDSDRARGSALALVRALLARKVPLQAVGFESHLDAGQPLGGSSFLRFIAELRNLGLQLLITEFDVQESRKTGDSLVWDQTVAHYYKDYLLEILPAGHPQAIIFWSIKDRWENGHKIQGLLQNDLSKRLSYVAASSALEQFHR